MTTTTIKKENHQSIECCMCGDYGLSTEIFHCQVCQFRSQHRYCSNLYPKSDPIQVCNWCLSSDQTKEKSQNSSNSSSSTKTNSSTGEGRDSNNNNISRNKKKIIIDNHGGGGQERSSLQLKMMNKPIKKQIIIRSSEILPSPSPSPKTRKRIITNGALEEKLRRTKSEEMTNKSSSVAMIRKPVFRNKVRRYKLLDEVSS